MNAETKIAEPANPSEYRRLLESRRAAREYLSRFTINNATPFGSPEGAVGDILERVVGLSTVLSKAYHDADRIGRSDGGEDNPSNVASVFPVFAARTLEAIETLSALALVFDDLRSAA